MADGDPDDRIDRGLARYVPPDRTAGELVLKATALASDLLPGLDAMDPRLGAVVKGAALLGVWFFDRRKVDRVFPLLAAMKDKIREVEAKQDGYVRREEFRDLFEETLRRIADQPGPDRRAWLQNIFLNVIDQPRDHTENRLFLRLADELSINAHKILSIMNNPALVSDQMEAKHLSQDSDVPEDEIPEITDELARSGLSTRHELNEPSGSAGGYFFFVLTRLGRDFRVYRGGTS